MKSGLWINEREFRAFADQAEPLTGQIATRVAAGDFSGLFGLLPNPDPVLKAMGKDLPVYRNLLADPLVMGARRRRVAAVMGMERGFRDEDSDAPARVRKHVERVFKLLPLGEIVRAWIDGAFFGYRVSELLWQVRDGVKVPVPIAKPSEWFGFHGETGNLLFRPRRSMQGEEVPPYKFVVVGKMRSWENPYGEPDLAACFWPVTFKRAGFKFWTTFTEKYGMPWPVGKLPRNATQAEHDSLADKLAAMIRDAVATVPDDSSVELLTVAGTANAELYEKLLMFCRSEISIALLGNNQSVELQANKASSVAAQAVEASLRDDDAEMCAAGFNELARIICAVDFPGAPPPVYAFWEQEEVDEVQAKRDQALRSAGATFTNQYFEREYHLEPGDLAEPPKPGASDPAAAGVPGQPGDAQQLSFSEGGGVPDQTALDAAVRDLPADAISTAFELMLAPAMRAIERAATPDEVRQALLDAWPDMDSSELERLMAAAWLAADVHGRAAVVDEAAS